MRGARDARLFRDAREAVAASARLPWMVRCFFISFFFFFSLSFFSTYESHFFSHALFFFLFFISIETKILKMQGHQPRVRCFILLRNFLFWQKEKLKITVFAPHAFFLFL